GPTHCAGAKRPRADPGNDHLTIDPRCILPPACRLEHHKELIMTRLATLALVAAGLAAFATPAFSAEHEVKMLNKGSDGQAMVFEPAFLKVKPGDTVKFVPTDKGHDAETI